MLHYLKKAWPFWETYPESNSHHSSDVAFVRLWSNYYRTIHLYHPFCISILIAIIPSYHIIVYIYIYTYLYLLYHTYISRSDPGTYDLCMIYLYHIFMCILYIYILYISWRSGPWTPRVTRILHIWRATRPAQGKLQLTLAEILAS